jgi:glycerol-3-phosphate O-acyltransferase
MGLLRYLVDAYADGCADDVALVPVSIAYEQLQEVGAMAAEERGADKKPEGLGWLLGYARAQRQPFGRVHIGFGEPLSLREALGPPEAVAAADPAAGNLDLQKAAFEVCVRINRITPVTPASLVTLALLGVRDRALTVKEIRAILEPLLVYVERRSLPMTTGVVELHGEAGVSDALRGLLRHRVVTSYVGGTEPVYMIGPEQHIVAAHSRNAVIHWFVTRAIGELAMLRVAEKDDVADVMVAAWKEARWLRDLLKFEFFFAGKEEFRDELRRELELLDPDWLERRDLTTADARIILRSTGFCLAHRVLRSFLEAYGIVADRLAVHDPQAPLQERAFIAECLSVGRQYRLQQRIGSPESLSRELFATGLQLAANRGLVEPGAPDLAERRRAFVEELRGAIARAAAIDRLDEELRREAAG